MKKLIAVLACLICTAFLAGCTGGSPAEGGPDIGGQGAQAQTVTVVDANGNAIEPEQLISKAEAAQILGQDVEDGEKLEKPAADQKLVFYNGASPFTSDYLELSISQQVPEGIFAGDAADTAASDMADGIGYKYIFHTPGLHILSNGYYLIISGGNFIDETVHERLNQVGALAVANLKKLLGK